MIYYMFSGLIGALMMFCGDMLLYYNVNDFDYKAGSGNEAKMQAIIEVMKKVSTKRLTYGGLIGPMASFFYCIGFFHIVAMTDDTTIVLAFGAFSLLCFGVIVGGAYHSHCAYLGLLRGETDKNALGIVMTYFQKMSAIFYIAEGIGFVVLAGLIVTGNTILPRWAFFISPGILFLWKPIVMRLPRGIRIIVSGGWSNLISVIYYIVAIGCVCML